MGNTNEQIETPYNNTMKSERSRLEGIRQAACNLPLLFYWCLWLSVLVYAFPCSLVLEKVSLLLPEAITTIETALHAISILVQFSWKMVLKPYTEWICFLKSIGYYLWLSITLLQYILKCISEGLVVAVT